MKINQNLSKKKIENKYNCKVNYKDGFWFAKKGSKEVKELTLRNLELALSSNY